MSETGDNTPRICDYEGSDYRTRFWEGQGRDYEDRVERGVLQRLLPESGRRLLQIGAGFGRLSAEFPMYDEVVLLDYSFSQLQYARENLGDERYIYVAADAYQLPFRAGVFDGATMIRVLHHFEDAPRVLTGIRRVLAPGAMFILEYASKRNLKAMLRYHTGRQSWNPYTPEPVEFVELNYDFHPDYIRETLQNTHFQMKKSVPVSFFRLGLLKKTIPAGALAGMDRLMQQTNWLVSPSVFTKNTAVSNTDNQLSRNRGDLFACPLTKGDLQREGDYLINADGLRWQIRDGIYDFKAPVG